jgi:hypothetical protein
MGMDREKWLAIRNTPRKVGNEKFIHVSTNIGRVKDETHPGKIRTIKFNKGSTFRKTQNKGG